MNADCVNVCYCTEYEPEDGTCACGHPWTGHEFDLIPEGCCVTRIPCDHPTTPPEEHPVEAQEEGTNPPGCICEYNHPSCSYCPYVAPVEAQEDGT